MAGSGMDPNRKMRSSDVQPIKADHTAAHLQQFGKKFDGMLAKANELVERLDRDRGPIELPSPLSARRSSSVN
jgi:hypothetical protein